MPFHTGWEEGTKKHTKMHHLLGSSNMVSIIFSQYHWGFLFLESQRFMFVRTFSLHSQGCPKTTDFPGAQAEAIREEIEPAWRERERENLSKTHSCNLPCPAAITDPFPRAQQDSQRRSELSDELTSGNFRVLGLTVSEPRLPWLLTWGSKSNQTWLHHFHLNKSRCKHFVLLVYLFVFF